jgi:hypothetical protein
MNLIKSKGQNIKTDYKNITSNSGPKNSYFCCIRYIKKNSLFKAGAFCLLNKTSDCNYLMLIQVILLDLRTGGGGEEFMSQVKTYCTFMSHELRFD